MDTILGEEHHTPEVVLLQKPFIISASNLFIVSVAPSDTICITQKINSLWCQLTWTDTKNYMYDISWLSGPQQKINF
jgi:hypothetical protein